MHFLNILNLLFVVIFFTSIVNCAKYYCPAQCIHRIDNQTNLSSKHGITPHICEKLKGIFFSNEMEQFKCECCLIIRAYEESCKPPKNPLLSVMCAEGLYCDHKHICRDITQESKNVELSVRPQPLKHHKISRSFAESFADMLRKVLSCDCSKVQCDNEVTRQECEEHQGLFVDKVSLRNQCQCCDRCYVPRGQHQSCGNFHKKDVALVCDIGLVCSPFTHMCIEKREILSQFLKRTKKDDKHCKRVSHFPEDENHQEQNMYMPKED